MTDSSRWMSVLITVLALSACTPPAQEHSVAEGDEGVIPRAERPEKPAANSSAMIWRFIGPIAGTRGSMVIGHPTEHTVFYHGASGGLWKTPDAGLTWVPLGGRSIRHELRRRDGNLALQPRHHVRRYGRASDAQQR